VEDKYICIIIDIISYNPKSIRAAGIYERGGDTY
jgi:hypothetical protein